MRSDIGLPAQEGGALALTAGAGRGGEGGVGVVAQVRLSLAADLTAVTAVQRVLQSDL